MTVRSYQLQVTIPDVSFGSDTGYIAWADVSLNDYILAELSVTRTFDVDGVWTVRYRLLGATRIASVA